MLNILLVRFQEEEYSSEDDSLSEDYSSELGFEFGMRSSLIILILRGLPLALRTFTSSYFLSPFFISLSLNKPSKLLYNFFIVEVKITI